MGTWLLAALLIWAHAQGFAHRVAHGGSASHPAAELHAHWGETAHGHEDHSHAHELAGADPHAGDPYACAAFDATAVADAPPAAPLILMASAAPAAAVPTAPPASRPRHFSAYFSRAPPTAT